MGGFAAAISQQENEMKAYLISGVMLAMLAGAAHAQAVGPGGISGPGAPVGPGPVGAPPAPPKAPPSKAAHFILPDGDALVDVKCADDESMKICADITLQILDKLVALPRR
jgi:hypothetical protein